MTNLSIIESEKIEAIQSDLQEIKRLIQKNSKDEQLNKWLSKPEARNRLNVCQKTFDNYLKNGVISYSRFAGKIYIKAEDIQSHLEKNYISA
jgi:ribonucleotide reductase beta subunit family protein with ferritin-like domain